MSASFTLAMVSALYCNQGPVVDDAKCQDGSPAHVIELEFLKWDWPSDTYPKQPWEVSNVLNVTVDGKVALVLQPGNLTRQQLEAITKIVAPARSSLSIYGQGTHSPDLELTPTEPKPSAARGDWPGERGR